MELKKVIIDGVVYVPAVKGSTGSGSTGRWSTGIGSTGSGSTGNLSTGYWSTGRWSTGHCSTGSGSTGNGSTGNLSTGYGSTGDWSTGDFSTGDWSTGDFSTGDWSTGEGSTGDWSTGDFSTGHFCTKDGEGFGAFNKPIAKTFQESNEIWDAAEKPDCLYFELTKWILSQNMTIEERENNPKHKDCGGYLKVFDYKEVFTSAVTSASKEERDMIRALPNFNDEIFLEISGCDMRVLGD